VIRADAGRDIGLGHLARSLSLADAWTDLGGDVTIAASIDGPIPAVLDRSGIRHEPIHRRHPDPSDLRSVLRILRSRTGAWVACDGHGFDSAYVAELRGSGARVLEVTDGLELRGHIADVLLDPNAGSDELPYECAPWTRVLRGARYALIRREVLAARTSAIEQPKRAARVVVMLGGSDAAGQTTKVIEAIQSLADLTIHTTVVVGPHAPAPFVARSMSGLSILRDPDDLPRLMAGSHLAISAAGSTAWELCCLGVPALLLVVAADQVRIASTLTRLGAAWSLGWHTDTGVREIASAARELIGDAAQRRRMSAAGRELIDGRGPDRVAAVLMEAA
jgi:UDP-2,4-diacetamido-2,4,6-trideoxy-beta-L-altropyranose hydrolase